MSPLLSTNLGGHHQALHADGQQWCQAPVCWGQEAALLLRVPTGGTLPGNQQFPLLLVKAQGALEPRNLVGT